MDRTLKANNDGQMDNCGMPTPHKECFETEKYTPGSVVWAKYSSYSWWPGLVERNPDIKEYVWREKGKELYNVTFFGEKVSYAWVKVENMHSFDKRPTFSKSRRYKKMQMLAIEQAEIAFVMDIQERLNYYSFVKRYSGKLPKAVDFDTTIPDEAPEIDTTILVKAPDTDTPINDMVSEDDTTIPVKAPDTDTTFPENLFFQTQQSDIESTDLLAEDQSSDLEVAMDITPSVLNNSTSTETANDEQPKFIREDVPDYNDPKYRCYIYYTKKY